MNIKIKNVRLSYPNLFEAKSGPEGGEAKFNASFLLDKDTNAAEIGEMQEAILTVAKGQWGDSNVKWANGKLLLNVKGKGQQIKTCLRDGSEKSETAGYGEGIMFFSASNKMQPPVVDKNPHIKLEKGSPRPYAGCYVNAAIRLWAQDNQFGKRVNAQLQAVQFAADGESFGDAPIDPATTFETLEGAGDNAFDQAGSNADPDGIPF